MQNRGIYHAAGLSYEGSRDQGFGEHLVELYGNSRRPIKPYNAGGGSPLEQVKNTHKYQKFNGCEKVYVVHDGDRRETAEALELADKYGYETILAHRTIEDELLRILPNVTVKQRSKAARTTDAAKEVFMEVCKLDSINGAVDWKKYFPKSLLDKARETSSWHDQFISAIEG